jgi:hypothetical protein
VPGKVKINMNKIDQTNTQEERRTTTTTTTTTTDNDDDDDDDVTVDDDYAPAKSSPTKNFEDDGYDDYDINKEVNRVISPVQIATEKNDRREIDSDDEDVFEDANNGDIVDDSSSSSSSSFSLQRQRLNTDNKSLLMSSGNDRTNDDVEREQSSEDGAASDMNSERAREEDFSEMLRYVKQAVNDEDPLKYERLGTTLWQLSNDALEQLANREEMEQTSSQQGTPNSDSIFSLTNNNNNNNNNNGGQNDANSSIDKSKEDGLNLKDLPRCVQLAAQELPVFAKALTIDPGSAYRPGSSKTRVYTKETTMPAVGSHRVGAAEIIAMMLQLGCIEIDEKIAHLKLEESMDEKKPMTLETLAIMLFDHPWSSAFHAASSRAILAALSSPHEQLWMPLVVCRADRGEKDVYKNCLPTKVAETMEEALLCERVSRRKGNVGSAVVLANALREFGEAIDEERIEMRKHLQKNLKWVEANKDGGSLDRLNKEQIGGLCGPKPSRQPQFLETNGGGNVISSHELLRMLQHISLGGGGGGGGGQ